VCALAEEFKRTKQNKNLNRSKKMKFEEKILKYEPHDCHYMFEGNVLLTKHADENEWVEVDIEHCIAEGMNHYEVYKHFGAEQWYVKCLFDYSQNEVGNDR